MHAVRDPSRELLALRQRVLDPLRRVARARERPPPRATFDPVKVEAEFYDSIYGSRSGTVENVAPVGSDPPAI